MKIARYEAQPYIEELLCACGGTMSSTGVAYPTYPQQYLHKCSACAEERVVFHVYPRQVWGKGSILGEREATPSD